AALHPADNLAPARRAGQLAVQQGQELALRRQPTDPDIRPVRRHQPLEILPRHVLQQLMKYAILVQHGIDLSCPDRRQTSRTVWYQRHAPCPPKLNRTAVRRARPRRKLEGRPRSLGASKVFPGQPPALRERVATPGSQSWGGGSGLVLFVVPGSSYCWSQ